jgi:NADPH:quinone reductase-like Zn-dependent oxidoreductase
MNNKIIQHRFVSPEVPEFVTAESPTCADVGQDEVFVWVAFAGVSPIDVMTLRRNVLGDPR